MSNYQKNQENSRTTFNSDKMYSIGVQGTDDFTILPNETLIDDFIVLRTIDSYFRLPSLSKNVSFLSKKRYLIL